MKSKSCVKISVDSNFFAWSGSGYLAFSFNVETDAPFRFALGMETHSGGWPQDDKDPDVDCRSFGLKISLEDAASPRSFYTVILTPIPLS